MAFFKKKQHNLIDEEPVLVDEEPIVAICDTDDFDEIEYPVPTSVSRKDFHKMAEQNLAAAVADGVEIVTDATDIENPTSCNTPDITHETENTASTPETELLTPEETADNEEPDESPAETNHSQADYPIAEDTDDFEYIPTAEEAEKSSTTEQIPETEEKPSVTFTEFCSKHRKTFKVILIVFGALLCICLGIYIYGCATIPEGVMGRNIYIEDVNVSGLSYEEALAKVSDSTLLDNCNITVVCKGQTYTINGIDVGLSARIEDTVDKAMRYGKTGNVFIDGLANALQVVSKHTVTPSANVNEPILRSKLAEFGNIVYGELMEHKLEIADNKIVCTPGRTGFSGDTDAAYIQVVKAITSDDFSRIRVDLRAASPKDLTAEDINDFAYANPQDARFEIKGTDVTVVPEVWGRFLDMEAVRSIASQIYEGGSVISIPFLSSEPAVKAADLNQKLFNATLGSFYTNYGGSTANRAANVANAASKINGKILAPGEVFSFNDTVGKRSIANGFYQAPEYANGQTVMGIGGGTCQVSSTLYNAVLYADLTIVSRLNHMFTVGYCPAGQDATVSDSGIDFKFSNNTDYPIKISATTSGGRITVSILGTQYDVPRTVKIQNYSTFSGGNQTVRSYRMVYDPNGTLMRKDDLGKSYYMAHQ